LHLLQINHIVKIIIGLLYWPDFNILFFIINVVTISFSRSISLMANIVPINISNFKYVLDSNSV